LNKEKFDRQIRIWGQEGQNKIEKARVLIVGAGGIGAEVIKNLVFLGFQHLMIVDLDKIEISNLNRQFFFDEDDQGKYKAETLARKIRKINPQGKFTHSNEKIQSISIDDFQKFDYIISALDNLASRIWLNEKCIELQKIMIDGGAEGFIGHVQVILPRVTPCLMCQNLWIPRTENYKCNYAINPRTPEDCALEARDKFFLENKRPPKLENSVDLEILFQFADKHAKKFGIIGITTPLIVNTLKHTVAQIITTNGIIGTAIANELLKIVLSKGGYLKDEATVNPYLQYNGLTGKLWDVPLKKNDNCIVCSKKIFKSSVDPSIPLEILIGQLEKELQIELISPTIIHNNRLIYRYKGAINESEKVRLDSLKLKKIKEVIDNNNLLYIEDEETNLKFKVQIEFSDE